MPEYKCTKCTFITDQKGHYDRHVARKRPCDVAPSNTVPCHKCQRPFAHYSSMMRHHKTCREDREETRGEDTQELKNMMVIMQSQMQELKAALESRASASTVNNVTNNTNNNNTINIHIHNFGSEDTSYITTDMQKELLVKCSEGLMQMIKIIHFHPDHPENANVRLKSVKQKTVEVHKDGKWLADSLNDVTEKIVDKAHRMQCAPIFDADYQQEFFKNHPIANDWRMSMFGKNKSKILERTRILLMNERDS